MDSRFNKSRIQNDKKYFKNLVYFLFAIVLLNLVENAEAENVQDVYSSSTTTSKGLLTDSEGSSMTSKGLLEKSEEPSTLKVLTTTEVPSTHMDRIDMIKKKTQKFVFLV